VINIKQADTKQISINLQKPDMQWLHTTATNRAVVSFNDIKDNNNAVVVVAVERSEFGSYSIEIYQDTDMVHELKVL